MSIAERLRPNTLKEIRMMSINDVVQMVFSVFVCLIVLSAAVYLVISLVKCEKQAQKRNKEKKKEQERK